MAKRKLNSTSCFTVGFIIVWCLGFFGGIVFGVVAAIIQNANDYTRITGLNYVAEVMDDEFGKVHVTEQITYDIHCAREGRDNLEWEIWRDLAEDQNYDGVRVHFNVISVKRLKADGSVDFELEKAPRLLLEHDPWSTWEANKNTWFHSEGPYNEYYDRWECLLIYPGGVYREVQTYEIEYEIINASMRYGDCSELYLNIFEGAEIKWLKSFSAEIQVPMAGKSALEHYTFNTFGTKAGSIDFEEKVEGDWLVFSFSLDEAGLKFKPYNRLIEFSLVTFGEDKHYFTENNVSINSFYNSSVLEKIQQEQLEYDRLPQKWANIKLAVLVVALILAVLIIWGVVRKDKKVRERYKFFTPEIPFDKFRDVPSPLDTTFAAALVFSKHKLTDKADGAYAAAMMSLARKNYITIEQTNPNEKWDDKTTKINIAEDGGTPREKLTPTETLYFELIRRYTSRGEISIKTFQNYVRDDYDNTHAFVKKSQEVVKIVGVHEDYFQKADYKRPKREMLTPTLAMIIIAVVLMPLSLLFTQTRLDMANGAFFVLGAALIIGAVLKWLLARKYVLLTQKGEDEYAKWRGLYNFLKSDSLMNEQTIDRIEMWEEYLVYATAFGIADKVLKVLEVKHPEFAAAQFGRSSILRHAYFRSHTSMRTSSRSFSSATRSASGTSRFGGGYGGGGRGGGGGGGS